MARLGRRGSGRFTPGPRLNAVGGTRVWRPYVLLGFVGMIFALVAGCSGRGGPTEVGSHCFENLCTQGGSGIAVFDPPIIAPLLGNGPAYPNEAQFAPQGDWLYVLYYGDTVAAASVSRPRSGVLRLDIRARIELCFPCAAMATLNATRVHLDPPVDPGVPPELVDADSGRRIAVKPWAGQS